MAGINLAERSDVYRLLYSKKDNRICVFLSHQKEDALAASSIGKYLTEVVGVDIYLDSKDIELKEAVSIENDKRIVDSIKRGLSFSTHILCITSNKTRLSWWVPYEIGIADATKLNITTLKLKDAEDVPSFLKINGVIENQCQFLIYCSKLSAYGGLFSRDRYEALTNGDLSLIKSYIQ